MLTIVAAVIAVTGTLLGSIVTFVFQRKIADRAAAVTLADRLRQDRLAAYAAYAEAVLQFRQTQQDRWGRQQEDPEGEPYLLAKAESHRKRAVARTALLRVHLVTDDPRLRELGEAALEQTRQIHEAVDRDRWLDQADAALDAITHFINEAALSLQATAGQVNSPRLTDTSFVLSVGDERR